MSAITHLVFDLGGVIIELRGSPIKESWLGTDMQPEAIWRQWLLSAAPKDFESGKIHKEEFAARVVKELSLNVSEQEFLDYFTSLPIGPYAGAKTLLSELQKQYKTALFSNSNEIHWPRKTEEMELGPYFDHHFVSHLMGLVKPDIEAFNHVVGQLAVPASQILFFDDNQLNVDGARSVGMLAERVVGFEQLPKALRKHIGRY